MRCVVTTMFTGGLGIFQSWNQKGILTSEE